MSYSAGRLSVFVDLTTPKEDYTTVVFDSMTQPVVQQLCTVFGMVVFSDLTEETTRGHRYFIGYSGAEYPSYAIGWAVGNTQENYLYLLCVGLFQGEYLSTALDTVSSSSISATQYCIRLLIRYFSGNSYDFTYINYVNSDKFKAITDCYGSSTPTVTSSNAFVFAVFFSGTKKMVSYRNSNYYNSYDASNDGALTIICPSGSYFKTVKNIIANSDFEYIAQTYGNHYVPIDNVFLYSNPLTINKVYKINGNYYLCLTSVSSDGSYVVKLDDYVA